MLTSFLRLLSDPRQQGRRGRLSRIYGHIEEDGLFYLNMGIVLVLVLIKDALDHQKDAHPKESVYPGYFLMPVVTS